MMKFRSGVFSVLDKIDLRCDVFMLRLLMAEGSPLPVPGQFYMIESSGFFLRRPVSVFGVEKTVSGNEVLFLIRKKGDGTQRLSELTKNCVINLSGPHGMVCPLPADGKRVILCAGGIGLACVFFLGRYLVKHGVKPVLIYGENKADDILFEDEIKRFFPEVIFTSSDGLRGGSFLVTDALKNLIKNDDCIYACGPDAMYETMLLNGLYTEDTFIFTEERMACGIGACAGCSILTKDGYKRVCSDGPVFRFSDIYY